MLESFYFSVFNSIKVCLITLLRLKLSSQLSLETWLPRILSSAIPPRIQYPTGSNLMAALTSQSKLTKLELSPVQSIISQLSFRAESHNWSQARLSSPTRKKETSKLLPWCLNFFQMFTRETRLTQLISPLNCTSQLRSILSFTTPSHKKSFSKSRLFTKRTQSQSKERKKKRDVEQKMEKVQTSLNLAKTKPFSFALILTPVNLRA